MKQSTQAPEITRAGATRSSAPALSRVRFGEFEVDFEERRLKRNGVPVKIQRKPFEILRLLLERPGALVPRARIAHTLWPDLHVSYEQSLNTAVNSLRECLGDSGRHFRLIETCSGAGYRFIGPVELPVLPAAPAEVESEGTLPDAARRDYLTGRFFFNKISLEGMTTATAHFSSAIKEDPSSAMAYAGLSDVYNQFALWGTMAPREAGKHAEDYARSALWLSADRPEPYVAKAGVKRVLDWDWAGAERLYCKALELDGTCEGARVGYADLLLWEGRTEEAAKQIQAALSNDPLSRWAGLQQAWLLFVIGEYRRALEQVWHLLLMDPEFALGHYLLGLIYEQIEMQDDAITELETARHSSPVYPAVLAALSHLYGRAGDAERARTILVELTDLSEQRYVSPYCLAVVHAGLGNRDACIAELQRAYDTRDIQVQAAFSDPRLAQIRGSDARLSFLLSRMGLRSGGILQASSSS